MSFATSSISSSSSNFNFGNTDIILMLKTEKWQAFLKLNLSEIIVNENNIDDLLSHLILSTPPFEVKNKIILALQNKCIQNHLESNFQIDEKFEKWLQDEKEYLKNEPSIYARCRIIKTILELKISPNEWEKNSYHCIEKIVKKMFNSPLSQNILNQISPQSSLISQLDLLLQEITKLKQEDQDSVKTDEKNKEIESKETNEINANAEEIRKLLDAINNEPLKGSNYSALARCLSEGQKVKVGSVEMDKKQLYLTAIDTDPELPTAYIGLASTLPRDGQIILYNGFTMTVEEIHLKIIQLAPNWPLAYSHLAISLPSEVTAATLLDGTVMTKQELYLKTIELKPDYAPAYAALANTLPSGVTETTLMNGTVMTRQELYLKTIELKRDCAPAYAGLANTLDKDEEITLPGNIKVNNHQLRAIANRLNPNL